MSLHPFGKRRARRSRFARNLGSGIGRLKRFRWFTAKRFSFRNFRTRRWWGRRVRTRNFWKFVNAVGRVACKSFESCC